MSEHGKAGRLTTHVLDVSSGKPASGVRIDLYAVKDEAATLMLSVRTKSDGRCDAPLLAGDALKSGEYELRFHAGDYLDAMGVKAAGQRFLNIIPIRFGIDDTSQHYHVPLLVAPYGYSTYRGS